MVGARLPGVILAAAARFDRSTLYWHRTCFCAAANVLTDDRSWEKPPLTDDASYSSGYEIDQSWIRGILGLDENGCT